MAEEVESVWKLDSLWADLAADLLVWSPLLLVLCWILCVGVFSILELVILGLVCAADLVM